jgi:hypothetical protein
VLLYLRYSSPQWWCRSARQGRPRRWKLRSSRRGKRRWPRRRPPAHKSRWPASALSARPSSPTLTGFRSRCASPRFRCGWPSPAGAGRLPDATLEKRADGSVAPKAAAPQMVFSGGGDGDPLARIASRGRSLELKWPGELPEPQLDGASALYPEVLPGVDLKVTATVESFQHVLVVKTPQAAASEELKKLTFGLKTAGLNVREARQAIWPRWTAMARRCSRRRGPDVGLGGPGRQSGPDRGGQERVGRGRPTVGPVGSSPVGQGTGARPGRCGVPHGRAGRRGLLEIVPDTKMLTGTAASAYPLFIDPASRGVNPSAPAALGRLRGLRLGQRRGRPGQGRGQVRHLERLLLRAGLCAAPVLRVLPGRAEGQEGPGRDLPGD